MFKRHYVCFIWNLLKILKQSSEDSFTKNVAKEKNNSDMKPRKFESISSFYVPIFHVLFKIVAEHWPSWFHRPNAFFPDLKNSLKYVATDDV